MELANIIPCYERNRILRATTMSVNTKTTIDVKTLRRLSAVHKVTRSEIAERMGVSRAYVSAILHSDTNHKYVSDSQLQCVKKTILDIIYAREL